MNSKFTQTEPFITEPFITESNFITPQTDPIFILPFNQRVSRSDSILSTPPPTHYLDRKYFEDATNLITSPLFPPSGIVNLNSQEKENCMVSNSSQETEAETEKKKMKLGPPLREFEHDFLMEKFLCFESKINHLESQLKLYAMKIKNLENSKRKLKKMYKKLEVWLDVSSN